MDLFSADGNVGLEGYVKKWKKVAKTVLRLIEDHAECTTDHGLIEGCSMHEEIQSAIGLLRLKYETEEMERKTTQALD